MTRTKRRFIPKESFFDVPVATSSPVQPTGVEISSEFELALSTKRNELIEKHRKQYSEMKFKIESLYDIIENTFSKLGKEIYWDISEDKYNDLLDMASHILSGDHTAKKAKKNTEKVKHEPEAESMNKTKMLPPVKTSVLRKCNSRSKSTDQSQSSKFSKCSEQKQFPPSSYMTPKSRITDYAIATVTPGPKMNAPTTIFRQPLAGEVAISLSGSPLSMAPNLGPNNVPQITIPLNDGRVMAVLPREGLKKEDFPDLDTNTIEALKLLHEFIGENVLKHNNDSL